VQIILATSELQLWNDGSEKEGSHEARGNESFKILLSTLQDPTK